MKWEKLQWVGDSCYSAERKYDVQLKWVVEGNFPWR